MIEILKEIKDIKSGKKELREFGLTIGTILVVLGGIAFWRARPGYIYLISSGVIFVALGVISPIILIPLQKVWMAFSVIMGFFMSRFILSALFYLIITPINLIMRIIGSDILDERLSKSVVTYWKTPKNSVKDKASYENQF